MKQVKKSLRPHAKEGFFVRLICALLSVVLIAGMLSSCASSSGDDTSTVQATCDSLPTADPIRLTELSVSEDTRLPAALGGVSAQSAVLLEATSGDVVFRQNEHARLPMASTTKIMTALVALETLSVDTVVTVTSEAVGVEGSSIYLTEGERMTLEDLLYALMLDSANDAAVAIAVAVAGSVDAFTELMNERAEAMGLENTRFVNPHGLDDPDHYTSAYDLALITREALQNDLFSTIVSTPRRSIPHSGNEGARLLLNHNKMLRTYDGAIGVKTGFTKKSGRCLVSAAERDGVTLIAVTLNDPNDWRDHTAMLDYGFSMYESVTLCESDTYRMPVWTVSGEQEYVMVSTQETVSTVMRRDHGEIYYVIELPRFVYAPVVNEQQIGRLVFFEERDGKMTQISVVPLCTLYGVPKTTYRRSLFDWLRS